MKTSKEILSDLVSSDAATQVPAVDLAADTCRQLAQAAVSALEKGPHRFLVAERLHRFGTIVVPLLDALLAKAPEMEPRILSGIVLLQLGSTTGVSCLIQALETGDIYAGLIACHLVGANVPGAIVAITKRLKSNHHDDIDTVVSLLLALKDSGAEIPPEVIHRFSGTNVPWQIGSLIAELSCQRRASSG